MRTFILAEAARLVGTSRGTLYRHIKRGRLGYDAAGGPGKSGIITEEALRQAEAESNEAKRAAAAAIKAQEVAAARAEKAAAQLEHARKGEQRARAEVDELS